MENDELKDDQAIMTMFYSEDSIGPNQTDGGGKPALWAGFHPTFDAACSGSGSNGYILRANILRDNPFRTCSNEKKIRLIEYFK